MYYLKPNPIMNYLLESFFNHRDLYKTSFYGGLLASIPNFFIEHTPKEMFGTSMALWMIILIINAIDIYTGIKADTKRKKDLGENFRFESNKGWRALEKIFIFTVVAAFIHHFEEESLRLELPEFFSGLLVYMKMFLFFYVGLVELQSIGENEEVRFKKKSKVFVLLDNIIDAVNIGIIQKITSYFGSKPSEEEPYE